MSLERRQDLGILLDIVAYQATAATQAIQKVRVHIMKMEADIGNVSDKARRDSTMTELLKTCEDAVVLSDQVRALSVGLCHHIKTPL